MIVILSKHPAWGASDNFYRAFKSCGYETKLLCLRKDPYDRISKDEIVFINRQNLKSYVEKSELLVVCSPVTINTILHKVDSNFSKLLKIIKNKVIFITGTEYIKNYKGWNHSLDYMGFDKRFCEAEMIKLNPSKNLFLPHPMEYNIPIIKNSRITISHAPGLKERPVKKGTPIILSVIDKLKQKYDFDYDHIVGVPFNECLKRKSKSHIFIDQINPKVGGIGKNGYEALSLNCITLSSVNGFNDIPKKIRPPVINVNDENELYNRLDLLLTNLKDINNRMNYISKWKETINYKNTVKKLWH
jgi:hypothetical protein